MYKKLILAAAFVAAVTPSFAHEVIYYGVLSGLKEFPSNGSPGTGSATITMDLDLATMRVQANFSGLIGNTTASHIHFGNGPGTNGGVATVLPSFTNFPLGVKSGTYDFTYNMALASSYNPSFITNNGGTVGGAFNAFLQKLSEGKGYLNIHTSSFTGGELRADLQAVPEPSTVALMAAGLGAMVIRRRKRS